MKEITNTVQIFEILKSLQFKSPIYIELLASKIQIKPIAINSLGVVIRVSETAEHSELRKLSIHYNGNKMLFYFHSAKTKHSGIEILKPIKMIIEQAVREDINRLNTRDIFSELSISKIINANEIPKFLSFENSKISYLVGYYTSLLKNRFPNFSIYLSNKADARLRLMNKFGKAIYLRNKLEDSLNNDKFVPIDEYIKKIVNPHLLPKEFMSEICIPLNYKNYVPMGYMQVNSVAKMETPIVNLIENFANSFCREIESTNFFRESTEICKVIDISEKGIGFLHSQSLFFNKNFALGEMLVFNLNYQSKVTFFKGIVRNIHNTESKFRIGLEFIDLSELDMDLIQSLIELKKESEDLLATF